MRDISTQYDLSEFSSGDMHKHRNIILHYISNPEEETPFAVHNVVKLFKKYKVSAHYLIDRMGDIYMLVDPTKIAWHAGKSRLNGYEFLNQDSLGIELIGNDDEPFTDKQYDALVELCDYLCLRFGIDVRNIKGHQMVSDSSVRPDPKPDPGRQFDWINFGWRLVNRISGLDAGIL